MRQLIYALTVLVTVAAVAGVAAAEVRHPGFIARYQTGLGALFGLIGLGFVAFLNAEINRRRDIRLRRQEIRGLCHALAAELTASAINCEVAAAVVTDKIKGKKSLTTLEFIPLPRPVTSIYEANLDKIGLLGNMTREVVKTYEQFSRTRFYTDSMQEVLKTSAPLVAAQVNVDGHWSTPATEAHDLSRRLDAYEPPDG